ncbi:MAG: DUF1566 domain-containing protein [Chlorobium sp.]
MNVYRKKCFTRLWMVSLLAALSLVMLSALSYAVTVGEKYGGGVVFYVDGTGEHGLIAAPIDYSTEMDWQTAIDQCKELEFEGFHDWFLPNKEQLNLLYLNKAVVGSFSESNHYYWSSSAFDDENGWFQYFANGQQMYYSKYYYSRVRAIRAF